MRACGGGCRGRRSVSPGLCRKLVHIDGKNYARKGADQILPGVRTLFVTRSSQARHVIRIVCHECRAVETVGRGCIASRMEARGINSAARDGIEFLSPVDTSELAMLGDVHTNADNIVASEHVLVMARGILPLIEERIRGLHRVLGRPVSSPFVTEVFAVVVSDILSSEAGFTAVKGHAVPILPRWIVTEVVCIGHMLAP